MNIFPKADTSVETEEAASEPVLYDVALSTMWHVDQDGLFNEAFVAAKQIGIARFELNHQVTVDQLEGWDRDHHFAITVHDPCPAVISLDGLKQKDWLVSSTDEQCRLRGVDVVKRTFDLAVSLGSRSIVLHVGTIQCDRSRDAKLRKLYRAGLFGAPEYAALKNEMLAHRQDFSRPHLDAVKKSLCEIIEFARGSGVALGIENRYRYYDIPLPDEMEELLGMCDEPWYGFQLDTGHAVALDRLRLASLDDWLERFSNRMIGVHLHDVDGITDHQVIGEGSVDFSFFGKYLPANCHRTMEINPKATLEQIADGLEKLVASGCTQKY